MHISFNISIQKSVILRHRSSAVISCVRVFYYTYIYPLGIVHWHWGINASHKCARSYHITAIKGGAIKLGADFKTYTIIHKHSVITVIWKSFPAWSLGPLCRITNCSTVARCTDINHILRQLFVLGVWSNVYILQKSMCYFLGKKLLLLTPEYFNLTNATTADVLVLWFAEVAFITVQNTLYHAMLCRYKWFGMS